MSKFNVGDSVVVNISQEIAIVLEVFEGEVEYIEIEDTSIKRVKRFVSRYHLDGSARKGLIYNQDELSAVPVQKEEKVNVTTNTNNVKKEVKRQQPLNSDVGFDDSDDVSPSPLDFVVSAAFINNYLFDDNSSPNNDNVSDQSTTVQDNSSDYGTSYTPSESYSSSNDSYSSSSDSSYSSSSSD